MHDIVGRAWTSVRAERGAVAWLCHQNVTETQATEYPKSTHREAGLAISMVHTGLSSARREADESTLAALFDVR